VISAALYSFKLKEIAFNDFLCKLAHLADRSKKMLVLATNTLA